MNKREFNKLGLSDDAVKVLSGQGSHEEWNKLGPELLEKGLVGHHPMSEQLGLHTSYVFTEKGREVSAYLVKKNA